MDSFSTYGNKPGVVFQLKVFYILLLNQPGLAQIFFSLYSPYHWKHPFLSVISIINLKTYRFQGLYLISTHVHVYQKILERGIR